MNQFSVKQIGTIINQNGEAAIQLEKQYIPALTGLDGFSHIQVLWWFDGCDNAACRTHLTEQAPYRKGPDVLGTFATRSPMRPNPIALSTAYVTYIDAENGIIGLAYLDANNGTPVLDIKPYTPSLDKIAAPEVPDWCAHWPSSNEESGSFDWESEFNF